MLKMILYLFKFHFNVNIYLLRKMYFLLFIYKKKLNKDLPHMSIILYQ